MNMAAVSATRLRTSVKCFSGRKEGGDDKGSNLTNFRAFETDGNSRLLGDTRSLISFFVIVSITCCIVLFSTLPQSPQSLERCDELPVKGRGLANAQGRRRYAPSHKYLTTPRERTFRRLAGAAHKDDARDLDPSTDSPTPATQKPGLRSRGVLHASSTSAFCFATLACHQDSPAIET
jgi:hypothetical protein